MSMPQPARRKQSTEAETPGAESTSAAAHSSATPKAARMPLTPPGAALRSPAAGAGLPVPSSMFQRAQQAPAHVASPATAQAPAGSPAAKLSKLPPPKTR